MIEVFKNLSKRELKFIIILLTIIFLYMVYVIIFAPSLRKLAERESELFRLEGHKAKLNSEVRHYHQLKNKYQDYNYENLLLQFPNEGKVPQVILWIEDLFQDYNLSRPSINFSRCNDQEQYLQISLNFTGPYGNIEDLINKIEANERLTTIETINLNAGSGYLITGNLLMRVYGQNFQDVSAAQYNFNKMDLFRGE
jgi:Tfp pilus assembly protein PilO